jgi:hypothetical protein
MWSSSRSRNRNGPRAGAHVLATRSPRRRVRFFPQTEALDPCCRLSFGNPVSTTVPAP